MREPRECGKPLKLSLWGEGVRTIVGQHPLTRSLVLVPQSPQGALGPPRTQQIGRPRERPTFKARREDYCACFTCSDHVS